MAKSKPKPAANGKPAAPLSPLDVLTLAEAAAYLRLPEDAVREEAEAGRLVGQHVRGEWRFVRAAVATWLQAPSTTARPKTAFVVESAEEYEAFMATVRAQRDEVNRATQFGKYAEG